MSHPLLDKILNKYFSSDEGRISNKNPVSLKEPNMNESLLGEKLLRGVTGRMSRSC